MYDNWKYLICKYCFSLPSLSLLDSYWVSKDHITTATNPSWKCSWPSAPCVPSSSFAHLCSGILYLDMRAPGLTGGEPRPGPPLPPPPLCDSARSHSGPNLRVVSVITDSRAICEPANSTGYKATSEWMEDNYIEHISMSHLWLLGHIHKRKWTSWCQNISNF